MKWCNLNHLTAKVKCRYLYFLTVTVIENVFQLIQTILSIKKLNKAGDLTRNKLYMTLSYNAYGNHNSWRPTGLDLLKQ